MLFDLSGYSGYIRMHSSESRKSERPTAGNGRSGKLSSAPVEDLVPNPGLELPSLGHPDSGTISHLSNWQSASLGDITYPDTHGMSQLADSTMRKTESL